MTVPLTPASAALPTTVEIPADGELVNSASVQGYVQTLINGIQFATDLVNKFASGGVIGTIGSVLWSLTGNLQINQLIIPPAGAPIQVGADGITALGRVRAPKRTIIATTAAGLYLFNPVSVDNVFNAATTSGITWKMDPGASPANGECIGLFNHNSAPIAVQDQTGASLGNLQLQSGFIWGMVLCWNPPGGAGASWQVVDYRTLG